MSDITLGPDYDPNDTLAAQAETGYDHARRLTLGDLAAMRSRGRPPTVTGQSRTVSARMNPELLRKLQAAAWRN